MASNQNVSVHYRHVELQNAAALRETDDGRFFLELPEPPPVRTVLELRDAGSGGAQGSAYEITSVVEVESAGVSRGCFVRRIDDAALTGRAVGSERFADASGGSSSTGTMPAARSRSDDGEERWSDDYGAQMAVPAPVVDPDGGDDSGETAEGSSASASDDEASDGDDDAAASSTDVGESPPPGKKRRGRKRK